MSNERAVSFDDPVLQRGFTQIPNVLLRDSSLSLPARATYAMLASFAWEDDSCYPGQKRVAEMLAVSERSLRDYLNELAKSGWLEVKQRGLGQTNLYRLLVPDRKQAAGLTGSSLPDRTGDGLPTKKTQVEEDSEEEKKPPSSPTCSTDVQSVWSHYETLFPSTRGKGLTKSRVRVIEKALAEFTVDEVKRALDGAKVWRSRKAGGTDIGDLIATNPNSGSLSSRINWLIDEAEKSKPSPASGPKPDVLDDEWRRANGVED